MTAYKLVDLDGHDRDESKEYQSGAPAPQSNVIA